MGNAVATEVYSSDAAVELEEVAERLAAVLCDGVGGEVEGGESLVLLEGDAEGDEVLVVEPHIGEGEVGDGCVVLSEEAAP